MSDIFWPSLSASVTASGSILALALQKALQWRRKEATIGLAYVGDKSNWSYAFSDEERKKRLVPFTAIMAAGFVFQMFYECQSYWKADFKARSIWQLVEVSSIVLSWMYILLLAVLSQQYPLPNRVGWILNVHLCVFYLVTFLASLHAVWGLLLLLEDHAVSFVIIAFARLFLNFDLLFITATVHRGPPVIDSSGRPVQVITTCSLWQNVTFLWSYSIVKMGQLGRQIEDADIASLPPRYRAKNLFEKAKQTRTFGIIKRTTIITLSSTLPQVITSFFMAILHYGPPYMMNRILVFMANYESADPSQNKPSLAVAYANIIGLFATTILYEVVLARTYYNATLGDVCTRGAYYMEIYAKTLKRRVSFGITTNDNRNVSKTLDNSEPRTVGSVVNLMSVDTIKAAGFYGVAHEVIQAPTELVVAVVLLYQILGTACFLGFSIIAIALPINHYNAKWLAITQRKLMKIRDKRVALTNEIMQSIRQVKLFAWEEQWESRILAIRNDELKQIKNIALYQLYFDFVWQGCPLLVTLLSFWYYTEIQGQELTAATAFTSLLIYEELRYAFNNIPSWMSYAAQYIVSLKRIESYLSDEELEPIQISQIQPMGGNRIAFENADIGWSAAEPEECTLQALSQNSSLSGVDKQFTISDATLEIPHNKMTIICGSIGAGKTLLILGLLGEAYLLKGDVYCPRSPIIEDANVLSKCMEISETGWIIENAIAYVAQTPWLQNASIRDNILFGLPLNEERYKEVLFECALLRDLTQFEDGDLTEIGEKGITLSGGQKARVALARAVYSRAQHLLMDDVLSAVDAYTAKHIYQKCIMGPLMRNRTRLLVTHHVRLCLEGAVQVVIMDNGKIKAAGHPEDLRNDILLSTILDQENQDLDNNASKQDWADRTAQTNENNVSFSSVTLKPKVLVPTEKRASGYVKFKLYAKYLKAMGGLALWSLLVFVLVFTRGMKVFESYWVKRWTDSSAKEGSKPALNTEHGFRHDVDYYITVYAIIALVQLLFNVSRFAIVQFACIRAARALYAEVLHSVFRAPLRFFDTTPVGRILNRFSKDFETIDSMIPNYTIQFSKAGINIISILLVVCFTIPTLFLPLSVAMIAFWYIGKLFIEAGIQVRRLESINRSLVFTHFTETIAGVTTLRAFGLTSSFLAQMADLADRNLRPTYCMWTMNRWMTFMLTLISVLTSTSIAIYCVMNNERYSASVAGLCLSYSLTFTDQALDVIRRSTSMQISFNAVERIEEYTEIDQEAPAITTPRPPSSWPHEGNIEVRNLHARYSDDLDPVLRGISFNVKSRERVGIVGRTGSGKSTIALSIFRFIEAFEGTILIDGLDIAKIGTSDLRSSMSIIPQDPVLFSGTLRTNLDPFDTYSDEEIYMVLKRVHLISDAMEEDTIASDSSNANVFLDLDSQVSEGGNNFSHGQRQLICLARALLQGRRIVVMDEATASVDFKTDEAIQRTISSEFKDSTILCIAHRLLTVIEYDRILVIEQGKVVEFDNPYTLIMNVNSRFHSMCKSSGEFDKLLSMGRAKHQLVDV